MRQLLSAWVALAILSLATPADACSCPSSGPPCQAYFHSDAVFVGTVEAITDVTDSTVAVALGERRVVALRVERAFRGVTGQRIDVGTGRGDGDCGYEFKAGQRYMVYASRATDGTLVVTICSRTRPAETATEDVQFFEQLASPGVGGRVFGTITHWERNLSAGSGEDLGPMPFVSVELRGATARLTHTDQQGRYEMNAVPPGKYTVRVVPPDRFSHSQLEARVDLPQIGSCAEVAFGMRYDGHIRGSVLAAEGGSAANVAIQLIAAGDVGRSGNIQTLDTTTDAGGGFEFTELSPGKYVIGVNLKRTMSGVAYPLTFHPGTSTGNDATIVTVGEGSLTRLAPFQLPPPRTSRVIDGVVRWPDGRPVSGASISLVDGQETWRQVALGIRTDDEGRFTFTVHDGLSYVARTHYTPEQSGARQVQATLGPFVVSEDTGPLLLTLPSLDWQR